MSDIRILVLHSTESRVGVKLYDTIVELLDSVNVRRTSLHDSLSARCELGCFKYQFVIAMGFRRFFNHAIVTECVPLFYSILAESQSTGPIAS